VSCHYAVYSIFGHYQNKNFRNMYMYKYYTYSDGTGIIFNAMRPFLNVSVLTGSSTVLLQIRIRFQLVHFIRIRIHEVKMDPY
jgi:hypothetical protein